MRNLNANDRIKARRIAQANANWSGAPRYLHIWNGVFWCGSSPCDGAEEIRPNVIRYSARLNVVNVQSLPACKGAKFLECIRGEGDTLIAKAWRRVKPSSFSVLVDFTAQ
jgi:hypothetical protein